MGKNAATKGLRAVHAKSIKGLAWASFIIAVADGALIPGTFVGDWVRSIAGWIPAPWGVIVSVIALVVGFVAVFLDCYLDLEPNQVAVIGALLLPTIASTIRGGLADWVRDIAHDVLHLIDQWLFKAAPDGLGSTALAVAVAVAVLMMASRVVKKSRKG
jgi:hypothetical protein